jgi:hypothetical protein
MAVQPDDVNLVRRDALLGKELRDDVAARLPDLRFDVLESGLFGRLGIADHGLLPCSSPVVIRFW